MLKLNVKAFGLAAGIVWGLGVFLLGLMSMYLNWGTAFTKAMSTMYIGYSATWLGSIIGGVWGFFDAGIGGVVLAWLYNKFNK